MKSNSFYLIFGLALSILLFTSPNALAAETPGEETPSPPEKTSFWKNKFRFDGVLWQQTAFRVGSPKNFSMIKQMVKMNFKFLFNDTVHMKIGGRAWYDAVYDLTDQYPPDVEDNMRKELLLRDAYLDFFLPNLNIRLGHQQVVWGESLGQFFADVVNPRDLRYFLLPTFQYIRLQIWALDLRYFFLPNATWEIVVTPDQTVDKLALPGSDFAFFIPPPPEGFNQVLLPDDRPSTNFKDWNVGTRITFLTHGWDFSWLYYTSLDHLPANFKTIGMDASGNPTIFLTPTHTRIHQYGFTFSKGIKSNVFRGEAVVTQGRFFNSTDPSVNDGVTKKNLLRYFLGIDASLGGKVDFTGEFQQQIVMGNLSDLADPSLDSWILLHFETGFLDEKLVPEITFIVGLRKGDTYIGPKLHFFVKPSLRLTWGADIFTGPLDTFYGEFRNSSRVFMNTQWSF